MRTNERIWVPGAQFLIKSEHSELYGECFARLQAIGGTGCRLDTFLIDGDAREACALRKAFPTASILRCTRHSRQTLRRRLGHNRNGFYWMNRALYAATRVDCEKFLELALADCSTEADKKYIRKKWNADSSVEWSLWSRMEDAVLREVTTTNAAESYHSLLKKALNGSDSLDVMLEKVKVVVSGRIRKANVAEKRDQAFVVGSLVGRFSEVGALPLSYQKLLHTEFVEAENLVRSSKDLSLFYYPGRDKICRCRFFRTHRLPCRHIFARYLRDSSYLSHEDWVCCKNEVEAKLT